MADVRGTERKPRQAKARETQVRDKAWEPPQVLPDPEPQEGYVFRWIRTATLGQADNVNASKRFREGWEPVKASDHPELMLQSDHDSKWATDGNIEYYARAAARQAESVDNNYLRESDPRMPKLNESSTRISFGSGRKPD
jgi:hypothetical protein